MKDHTKHYLVSLLLWGYLEIRKKSHMTLREKKICTLQTHCHRQFFWLKAISQACEFLLQQRSVILHNILFLNFQEEIEWKGKKITQFPLPVSISGLHLKNTPVARNEQWMGKKWEAEPLCKDQVEFLNQRSYQDFISQSIFQTNAMMNRHNHDANLEITHDAP